MPKIHPLHRAILSGRIDLVESLLANGASPNHPEGAYTPLLQAVRTHNIFIARILLEKGADVDARNENSYTPLMAASANGDEEMIKLFLDHGADVNAQVLAGVSQGLTSLHLAAKNAPRVQVVKALVDAGAKVNARTSSGSTPLMYAAINSINPYAQEIISYLINQRADLSITNNNGKSALSLAMERDYKDREQLLTPPPMTNCMT